MGLISVYPDGFESDDRELRSDNVKFYYLGSVKNFMKKLYSGLHKRSYL